MCSVDARSLRRPGHPAFRESRFHGERTHSIWLFPFLSLLRPRVARAQDTHQAIFTSKADFFNSLLEGEKFEVERSFDEPGAGESDDAERTADQHQPLIGPGFSQAIGQR